MMQSLGGDDDLPEETEEEKLRRRVTDLELQLSMHLNSTNNPHATDACQTGAPDKSQMRGLLSALEDHHEESASFVMKVLLCLMVFFVCALIHFASAIQKDWVMIGLSFFTAVVPYGLLSSHVNKHRRLAAKLRAQYDALLSNKSY